MSDLTDTHTPQVVGIAGNPVLARVWALAEPLCSGEGMELVHVEYASEHGGRILRVYLDKPGGVTLDDCVDVSRQLGDMLDVGLDVEGAYRLEVSSPGMPRPLGKIEDFGRFKGSRAKVRTTRPVNGRKNFTGILDGVDGPMICLNVDGRPVAITFTDIAKAYITQIDGENACT